MTTAPAPLARRPLSTRALDLRALLRLDAALCAATGVVMVAAAPAVADLLGPDVPVLAVRVVGAALLVWALDALLLSRGSERTVRRTTLAAGAANLAWEVATVVLVALGAFSLGGAVLALGVAAVVGGLGLVQLRAARRRPAGYSFSSGA